MQKDVKRFTTKVDDSSQIDRQFHRAVTESKDVGLGLGDVELEDVGLGDVGLEDVGLGDVGLEDVGLGDVGLGDVGLGDVGLGDVGLGDVGLGDVGRGTRRRGTWDGGLGDAQGLGDVINKQHLNL